MKSVTNLKDLLASNIKVYRCRLGISQAKLAEKIDISTNYVASIEAKRRFPSVDILEKIALALEIDTPLLFSMKPARDEDLKLLKAELISELETLVGDFFATKIEQTKIRTGGWEH